MRQLVHMLNSNWAFTSSMNKMFFQLSSLNVSYSCKSEEFNRKGIEVLEDVEEHPCFKQAHIGIFLELPQTVNQIRNLQSWS